MIRLTVGTWCGLGPANTGATLATCRGGAEVRPSPSGELVEGRGLSANSDRDRLFLSEARRGERLREWGLHGQHGTAGLAYHLLGHAAHQQSRQARSAVCPHHDQVGADFRRCMEDFLDRGAFHKATLRGEPFGDLEAIKVLSLLVMSRWRDGDHDFPAVDGHRREGDM